MINNKNKKISITIINGFLGSGKTTFLNNYIHQLLKKDEKITIIMNEFGSFDVDSLLIEEDITVKSLINGCVCCDLNNDLVLQLQSLIKVGESQHILIESTGIAHPLEVFAACQDPTIVNDVEIPEIIGLVDALRFNNRMKYTAETNELMEEQIKYSDVIILNKMDLVTQVELENIKKQLVSINNKATIYVTTYSKLDDVVVKNKSADINRHVHVHHHNVQSMKYTFSTPIDRQLFYQFIMRLPDEVFRLKGFVKFKDQLDAIYEFQFSMGLPTYGITDREVPLTIVIIGEMLDTTRLKNQLEMIQFT
ncbi:GTP-binding protein [Staphylococcus hominis]|uniref:CobW family GTP-binding protein n=1 Tax=Staphylococcus hominis TaxID=1290 RepID=UPI001F57D918|nr:GTP-binding protein [Staphylococcus hominis]MCI2900243.1 GTP-binding protein [Staphylococcus hominis]